MLIMMPTPSAYITRVKRASKRFTSALVAKRAKAHSTLAIRFSIVAMSFILSGVFGGGIIALMQALRMTTDAGRFLGALAAAHYAVNFAVWAA